MAQTPPIIQNGLLIYQRDGHLAHMVVDSPAWNAWLQTASTFTFRSEHGSFTARKERAGNRRGRPYWRAYRTWQGKLHRTYLGKSEELTLERLNAVASILSGPHAGTDACTTMGGGYAHAPQVNVDVTIPFHQASSRFHESTTRVGSTKGNSTYPLPPSYHLPAPVSVLIGREREQEAICTLLRRARVRLVTLTGTGGVGKTRLALEVAQAVRADFVDGICFVELAPVSDPVQVMAAIAQALGLRETADLPLEEQVRAYLQEKHLLLLLDNFEQIISAASQLAHLLTTCAHLHLLVTSRAVLHLSGEHEFAVAPLPIPDLTQPLSDLAQVETVRLFVERAQAIKADFVLTEVNARAIAEICMRLDGLPLAIELAAARIRLLPPQALLRRLSHRLQILTGGVQDAPTRQQTLRNTIVWSYNLLNVKEQHLFRRISVFVGGCTLGAVESICNALKNGDEAVSVLDGITSLIDESLLQQTEQEGDEPRFRMLETIHEYGLEMLVASGEMAATRQAHAAHYLTLAEEAAPELRGPQQALWLERLEREYANLRAAMQWFLAHEIIGPGNEMALRLGGALWDFWVVRGLYSEGRAFLEQALSSSEGVSASVRARALSAAADFALLQSDVARSEALRRESLALYREIGNTRGSASSSWQLAWVASRSKGANFASAQSMREENLRLYKEVDDKDAIAWSLQSSANIACAQGDYSRGRALFEESLAMYRELGNKRGIIATLQGSALWLITAQEDQTTACAQMEESFALSQEVGDKDGLTFYYWLAGCVALDQGDIVTAHTLVKQSLALGRELGALWRTIWALGLLGRIEALQGDFASARALHVESLMLAKVVDNNWLTAFCLEGLAIGVAAQGEETWAARLWGAAESLRASSVPLTPFELAAYRPAVAAARAQLGAKAFAAAWLEGRTMTPEQVFLAREPLILSLKAQPPTTRLKTSPAYPSGLTAREAEVLRLVAQGLTNAQIAERLTISLHTVNAHVRSIFNKLDVNSRNAVTRFAIEHKLM